MKLIINFIVCISSLGLGFSQKLPKTYKNYDTREVQQLAIYPGCEMFISNNDLNNCLSNQLNDLLQKKLKKSFRKLIRKGEFYARATIQFVITKEGKIILPEIIYGFNKEFNADVLKAFQKIQKKIPTIQAATLNDGTSVNLVMQLSVTFSLAEEEKIPQPETMVLFTLIDKETQYEIRLHKSKSLKAYESKNGEYTFLGNFNNISELNQSEPYHSLIKSEIGAKKNFVAEGKIEGQTFRIYIHNLFQPNKENPIYIEVQKVSNLGAKTIETFQHEKDFMNSPYSLLVYRE